MDFENLFSKPPNPALGKKPAADPEERIDETDGTEVEEAQTENVKRKVKRDCEPIPKKFKHLGHAGTPPKSLPRKKSRSKDYDPYSDGETCSQESEDNFDKELQQYIQAKEMASVAPPSLLPEESVKKAGTGDTQQSKLNCLSLSAQLQVSWLSGFGQAFITCSSSYDEKVTFVVRYELA